MYECLNPHCRKFAGKIGPIGLSDVFEYAGDERCLECGRPVRFRFALPTETMLAIPLVVGVVTLVVLAFTQ